MKTTKHRLHVCVCVCVCVCVYVHTAQLVNRCSAQVYYLPGLRAEKEITRSRMVQYIENVFGEKLSAQERNRLLPRPEEDDMAEEE